MSKPSVVWLNYKRTCLITSLSRACQRLRPKNKPWHIKKNAICFEWWRCLVPASSPCVGGGPEVTTSAPRLLNLLVPLTPSATLCCSPSGHHYPKTKAPFQTGPCSHMSSWPTSKDRLATNMQGWFDVDVARRGKPAHNLHLCRSAEAARKQVWVRFLDAPLDGAAESQCWSPLPCILSPPLMLPYIIRPTAINILVQTILCSVYTSCFSTTAMRDNKESASFLSIYFPDSSFQLI